MFLNIYGKSHFCFRENQYLLLEDEGEVENEDDGGGDDDDDDDDS